MPANIQVLLVDDNPMVLNLLKQGLAPLANLTVAEDGADALLKAIEAPPDLLISDFMMGGMDGRQLLTKLKVYRGSKHPHSAQKPTVLAPAN
jgi:CheY-like chemotaxis protein